MDPPEITPSPMERRENPIQLQGPRPTPLRVNKKIRKTPLPHAPKPPLPHAPPYQAAQPLIIYSVSPKPIHVDASNFMSIVQQLTGRDSSETGAESDAVFMFSGDAPVSPAARLAAMERASPTEREERERRRGEFADNVVGIDLGQMPGILSPAPANLPIISPGLFSPAPVDGERFFGESSWMNMMSPFMSNSGNYSFLPSPSNLFFSGTGIVSPSPSPGGDLFNLFDFS